MGFMVQESLAQVQASAESIAEKVNRFASTMRQLERQANTLINVTTSFYKFSFVLDDNLGQFQLSIRTPTHVISRVFGLQLQTNDHNFLCVR